MEKKITMNHNDKKIEYILYDTPPCKPFLNINGFYLRLSQIPSGDIRINGLYPYMQRNSVYTTNEDGLLRKIATSNGMEEWNYNVGRNINSVFSRNTNVFLANNESIREINDNKQLLKTLNIQADKTIADGDNFYITKDNKLSKITESGQEQFSYDLDSSIKDIVTDKVGNIYVATDKDVRKLAKKVIGDKDSKNLIRNSGNFINFDHWINGGCKINNDKKIYIKAQDNVRGDTYIQQFIKLKPNTTYALSIEYDCGKTGTSAEDRWHCVIVDKKNNKLIANLLFNNGKHRDCKTFTTDDEEYYISMGGYALKLGTVIITNIQLEEGDKATPWKPNPLDYVNIGEWKYSINANSIAMDSENNIYISTLKDIEKLNSKGQKIDTLDIQADKIALDLEDNMYISKDKSVDKLAKKVIGDKDSKNLLRETKGIFKGDKYTYGIKIYNLLNLKGKTITISCKARVIKQGKDTNVRMALYNPKWTICYQAHSKPNDNEWQTLVVTETIETDEQLYLGFWNDGEKNGGEVEIKEIQLEEGDKATPWQPNLNDYIRQGEWKYIDNSKINNICIG